MSIPLDTSGPRPAVGLADLPSLYSEDVVATRSTGKRAVLFTGRVLAWLAPLLVVDTLARAVVDVQYYATPADHQQAIQVSSLVGFLIWTVAMLPLFLRWAPKVSYRRRDVFFLFAPIWSIVFPVRVLWRLTALEDRPWPQRADELTY